MDYVAAHPEAADVQAAVKEFVALQQKRTDMVRDTKFSPPKPPAALGLRMLLPDRLGGLSVAHYEPSLEEFPARSRYEPGSPEEKAAYQDFKDEAWMNAHDAAVKAGHPIRREGMTKDEWDKSHARAMKGIGEADMAMAKNAFKRDLGGVLDLANGYIAPGTSNVVKGVVSKLGGEKAAQYIDEAEAMTSPEAHAALQFGGALLPGSLLGRAGGAIGKTLGAPESIAGGLVKGAATGGALGVAGNTAANIGAGLEDALRGKEKKGALSRIEETGVKSLLEAPGSFLGGAAFGILPGGAQGYRGGLRNEATDMGRALRAAEEAGVRTSVSEPGGLKPPPTLKTKGLGAFEHPTDVAVNKAKPLVARGAAKVIDETVSPVEAESAQGYKALEGKTANSAPLVKSTVRQVIENSYREEQVPKGEGADLPFIGNDKLRELLPQMADAKVLANHQAQAQARRLGTETVPLQTALQHGLVDTKKAWVVVPAPEPVPAPNAPPEGIMGNAHTEGRPTLPPGPADAAAIDFENLIRSWGEADARMGHIGAKVPMGAPTRPPIIPPAGPGGALVQPGDYIGAPSAERPTLPPEALEPRTPPQGISTRKMVEMRLDKALAAKAVNLDGYRVVYEPRDLDAQQVDRIVGAIDDAAGISEVARKGKPDPMYAHFTRAAREVRDQFGTAPGMPHAPDVTIPGPDGTPMTLTGWSALKHAHSEKLKAMKLRLRQAGMPTDKFDPTDVLEQERAGASLFGVGPGVGETNRTRALLDLAGKEPGGERAVKDVIASRIIRGGGLSPSDRAPVPSALNPVRAAAQLGHSVRYRLDPIAEFLGRGAPASGILGPKAADPVTQALLELDARIKQHGDHP